MKFTILGLCLAFITFVSCQKEGLDPAQQQGNGSNGTPQTSGILPSDRGVYGPFGSNSCWVYEDSTITYDCVVDSNGVLQDSSWVWQDTIVHADTVIIDSMEYILSGSGVPIRVKNGRYYQRLMGVDVQYMVETPTVGATWSTTIPASGNRPALTYDYTVKAIGQTLTVPAGTFTNVVKVEQSQNSALEYHYYAPGVGLIKQEGPRLNQHWERYLLSYHVL